MKLKYSCSAVYITTNMLIGTCIASNWVIYIYKFQDPEKNLLKNNVLSTNNYNVIGCKKLNN